MDRSLMNLCRFIAPRIGRLQRRIALISALSLAVTSAGYGDEPGSHSAPVNADGLKLFQTHVGSLLSRHCVKCHGGKKHEADLDLTTREGLVNGGASGEAIVPGKPDESLLYKMIAHAEEPGMPYEEPKLADDVIAMFGTWIELGAPYDKPLVEQSAAPKGKPTVDDNDRKFWSFLPLKHPQPPEVQSKSWLLTPIDNFVLARLEKHGIAPTASADRPTLIRRAYLDVIGLLPTPQEVEAFVGDQSADAYEKVVDRLLASPHYGERWGRHWLDLARFAESHGYEQDYDRPSAYHYRDFVIKALNADMPYDRFVRLQIAGDEMEPDNPLAMMATGYLGAGTHATQITANQVEKERYDELDDMTATIGTSLLGLTIGCARCHDHKFDPIPTNDYYRMLSTFTTTVRSEIELDLEPEKTRAAKEAFDREHAPLEVALKRFEVEELPSRLATWLAKGEPPEAKWLTLEPKKITSSGGAIFTRQVDGSYLASGNNADFDSYTIVAELPIGRITAIKVEALAHPSMPVGGPGRATNGNFDLTDLQVSAAALSGGDEKPLKLDNPTATFEQSGLPIAAAIDGDKKSGWAVDPQFGKDHAAVFEVDSPAEMSGGMRLTFVLKFDGNKGHNIGRLRLSICTDGPATLEGTQASQQIVEVNRALDVPPERRTAEQKETLLAWYKSIDPEWQKLSGVVQEHLAKAPKPALTKVMVTSEGLPAIRLHTQGADFFDKTYLLKRGDLAQKQGEATQGFLQVLMPGADAERRWQTAPPEGWRTSYRRTALAKWITDAEAGAGNLLARVIVNRLWQHHFGRGIVATPSDFGSQGERPSHPELLEFLASELVNHGWQLKPVHRLMLTSSAYLQSADAAEAAIKADPDNVLLSRFGRRRLEGEIIRDAMLSASGTMDTTMFGPGTLDEAMRRRSIYFFIKRSQLIPILLLFDGPDSLQSMGQRAATTIAPQALLLMNNPQVIGYAQGLAGRVMPQPKNTDDATLATSICQVYQIALSRQPDERELKENLSFVKAQIESYRAAGKTDAVPLALAEICQTIFALNEFMYLQ
jgi:hypothetical protein